MKYVLYRHKFILILILALCINCSTQQRTLTTENKAQPIPFYKLDYQGNRYHIHHDVIDKYSADGTLQFTYSNKTLGEIHSIDVTNPLRTLVFYKNLQQMVITDNTLSDHTGKTIAFDALGLYQVQMVASSAMDNGIWIYDQETFQLKKMTQQLEIIYQSGNLEQMLAKIQINPSLMIENNGFLFLVCPNNGILIFDMYGAYYKTLPVLNVTNIFPKEDFLYVVHDNAIEAFHLKSIETAQIHLNEPLQNVYGFLDNQFYGFKDGLLKSSGFYIAH